MLGIKLSDHDVHNVPLLKTDAFGKFIPAANGFAQVGVRVGNGADGLVGTADDVIVFVSGVAGGLDINDPAAISAALAAAGLPTQLWSGGQATAPRLAEGLGSAALLHYAGHGRAGEDALSAELLLADHQTFAVSNALGSPRVPARVVLSGCETARSVATDVESLGLGQAFVVAGSSAVIAAVRPVDDQAARVLIDGLYAAGVAQGDPAAAFRAAVRGAMAQGVDVSAFRLLVP